jgi:16S rRNA (adenine1518-N6/adenine1519-N6)-dimethyltransferase
MKVIPKKRFGQHFLRDDSVLGRIVDTLSPIEGETIVEVGAGDGALTRVLAPRASRLVIIEIDRECHDGLAEILSAWPGSALIPGDALEIDPASLPGMDAGAPCAAVGNLPYNAATAILGHFLSSRARFSRMVFMVQLEVAERITTGPGSKAYGYLSVFCHYHAAVRLCFKVKPASFVPRPKVMSAVVELVPRRDLAVTGPDAPTLVVARAAFAHRRKTLANSLGRDPLLGPHARSLLEQSGIDGSLRAEVLSLADFVKLGSIFEMRQSGNTETPPGGAGATVIQ